MALLKESQIPEHVRKEMEEAMIKLEQNMKREAEIKAEVRKDALANIKILMQNSPHYEQLIELQKEIETMSKFDRTLDGVMRLNHAAGASYLNGLSLELPTPDWIRSRRKEAGLTQAEAAILVHAAAATWQAWEKPEGSPGRRQMGLAEWELFLIKTHEYIMNK